MFGFDIIGIRNDKLVQNVLKKIEIIMKNCRG